MNEYFWYEDSAFMALVEKPLVIIGIAFAVMLAISVILSIRSGRGSDDA